MMNQSTIPQGITMNEQLVQSLLHEIVRLNYNLQVLIDREENNVEFREEVLRRLKTFDEFGMKTF